MIYYGLELHSLDTYFQFKELSSAPGTPPTNEVRVYAKDKSGTSALYLLDDAGSEREIAPANIVTGTGAANRMTYWSGTSTIAAIAALTSTRVPFADSNGLLTDSSSLVFDATNFALTVKSNASVIRGLVTEHYQTGGQGPLLLGRSASGTIASPGATAADQVLLDINGQGYSSGFTGGRALIRFAAGQTFTAINQGSYMGFFTTPLNSTTIAERFRIGPSGQWGIGGATYGTSGNPFISGGSSAAPSWASAFVFDNSNRRFGINATPTVDIEIFRQSAVPTIRMVGEWDVASMNSQFDLRSYSGTSANAGGILRGMGVRGTLASPTLTKANDLLMQLVGDGYTNALTVAGQAAMKFKAVSDWSASSAETQIDLYVTSSGSTSPVNILSLAGNGDISHISGARFRMASQNRFRYLNSMASVYRSTVQSINNTTVTAISWDSEEIDTDSLHDNSTNPTRITIALTGKYFVFGQIDYAANSTGIRQARIHKNGSEFITNVSSGTLSGTGITIMQVYALMSLSSGDWLELAAFHDAGVAINANDNIANAPTTRFNVVYLGE